MSNDMQTKTIETTTETRPVVDFQEVETEYNPKTGPFKYTLENVPDHLFDGNPRYYQSAENVREARKAYKKTQIDLAEALETDQSHVSNLERARQPIRRDLAERLSEIFPKYDPDFFQSEKHR